MVISPFLLPKEMSDILSFFNNKHKIAWVGDKFQKKEFEVAKNYDKIYYTDSYFVQESKKFNFPRSEYLPLAYNEKIFNNKNYKTRENKLLFIGNLTKDRVNFMKSISSINLKLIGKNNQRAFNHLSNVDIVNKNISILEVAEEYNKVKFILNMKHETNVVNGLNMRTFEAIASGSCLFQDNLKDIESNFEVNKEILIYDNSEDLIELLNKYSRDTKTLNKIIKEGGKVVFHKHRYLHRIKKILDI